MLDGFEGRVGLAHHVQSATEGGVLTAELPTGTITLSTLDRDPEAAGLDRDQAELPAKRLELAVTATGRHLRGTLAGKLVVHGHAPALPDGGVGILLDGDGELRIERISVTPITDRKEKR